MPRPKRAMPNIHDQGRARGRPRPTGRIGREKGPKATSEKNYRSR